MNIIRKLKKILTPILDVPLQDPEDARRRKLLNIMILIEIITVILAMGVGILWGIFGEFRESREVPRFFMALSAALLTAVLLYFVNRYRSGTLSSILFLVILTAVISVFDTPEQLVRGRSVLVFAAPIMMASMLLWPWASFVFAGLSILIIVMLSLLVNVGPSYLSIIFLLIIACISWISSRSLQRALTDLNALYQNLLRSKEALQKSEERLALAIESSGAAVYEHSIPVEEGVYLSENCAANLGYMLNELPPPSDILKWWEQQLHPDDRLSVIKAYDDFISGKTIDFLGEFRMRHKTGKWIHMLAHAKAAVRDELGRAKRVVGLWQDVSERKVTEDMLRASLVEKDILLKEIQHRVKNNLQIIISLLTLQAERIKERPALQAFEDSKNRIYSMALVHEKLYQSKDFTKIDFKEYVETMARRLFRAITTGADISLDTQIQAVKLGLDKAIPCGLIINELITNSLKHAFKGRQGGRIFISFKHFEDGSHELEFKDDGIGLPENVDFEEAETLGLHLIKMLTEQIKGGLDIKGNKGTTVKITFPP